MRKTATRRRLLAGTATSFILAALCLVPNLAAQAATGGYPQANMPCEWSPQDTQGPPGTEWCKNFDWGPSPATTTATGEETIDGPSTISPRGFGYRNCTDYVAWKLGFNSSLIQGNAADWRGQMDSANVTRYPTVGAVAWWGTEVDRGFGHVAVVLSVRAASAVIAEYNSRLDGTFDTRTVPAQGPGSPDAFLHIRDQGAPGGVAFSAAAPSPKPSPAPLPTPLATPTAQLPLRPVASPAPSPSPTVTVDAQRVSAGVLAGVGPAVSFQPPAVMRPGVAHLIEVRISQPSRLVGDLNRQLLPAGVSPLASGDPLGATLSGSGMHIEATTPLHQPLDGSDVAVWQWSVTPLKAGTGSLTLCFSLEVATATGRQTSPDSCLARRQVRVTSLPPFLAQGFVGRHLLPLALTGAVILMVGIGLGLRPRLKPGRRSVTRGL